MTRKKICLRNAMSDEGKDQSNGVSNLVNHTDDMDWKTLINGIVKTRMSPWNSSSKSMSTFAFTSTSTHNSDDVPLIPDEKKKGIYTENVKPLGNFRFNHMNREIGEPSCDYCVICGNAKPSSSTTVRSPCRHSYCLDCFQAYIAGKIQENSSTGIKCPEKNCEMKFPSHIWREFVPEEVYERKRLAYLESACLASPQTIKCPNCPFEFLDDRRFFLIRACTNCWSVICIMCMVRWHLGISCREFQAQQFQRLIFDF